MNDYKKEYTERDVEELKEWFEAHREELPASLQMDKATKIPDLPFTLGIYLENAAAHIGNPTYDPAIYFLYRIRRKLMEDSGAAE